MKHVIEVKITEHECKARYVLELFLTVIGYPFRFVEQWDDPALKILYSPNRNEVADIFIPAFREPERLNLTHIQNIPVLYDQDKPEILWDGYQVQFDLINPPYYLLTRQEELDSAADPQFFPFQSVLYELGILHRPIFNYYIRILREIIESKLKDKDLKLRRIPVWKDNQEFAVILSHDVDLVSSLSFKQAMKHLKTAIKDRESSRRQRFESFILGVEQLVHTVKAMGTHEDPAWNFEEWINLEENFNVRSTFYFAALEDRVVRDPAYSLEDRLKFKGEMIEVKELIRYLDKKGWEIGLHGSLKSCANRGILQKEKDRIENILQKSLAGIRQHHLKFRYPTTWQAQEQVGFSYDSTLGYNHRLGHRAGIAFPFRPYSSDEQRNMHLIELPLTIQDNVLFITEAAGTERALSRCIRIIEEVKATQGLVTLLWHPYTAFNPSWPEPIEVYRSILRYLDKQNAFVGTGIEIMQWWKEREGLIRAYENSDS